MRRVVFKWAALISTMGLVLSCATEIPGQGSDPDEKKDVLTGIDAAPRVDAIASPADAESSTERTATVTADCLYVRQGPGTDSAHVQCTTPASHCTVDNDLCILMGETVTVTGESASGDGCSTWYPVDYLDYSGWSCGEFLQFSGQQNFWQAPGSGPQG